MRALLVLVACASPVCAAEPKFAAKVEKTAPPDKLSANVRKLLDESALVVRDGDTEVMTVWFRAEVPAKASAEQVKNGLTYREIPEGELVGAVRFPTAFTDYRKQELAAGVYTLRFAVQPDIGDHTNTAPHPDFCLMCAADKDKSAEPMEKKKLIEVSSLVNEGRHPAVLLMWPHAGKGDGASVQSKGDGVWVAAVRRPVNADGTKSALWFAVTIAGQWKP